MVGLLLRDGRASAASIGRAADARWTAGSWTSSGSGHAWRLCRNGSVSGYASPPVRLAGDMSVLATALVTDLSALARFIHDELAKIPGIITVGVDVMLAEPRRYGLDRVSGPEKPCPAAPTRREGTGAGPAQAALRPLSACARMMSAYRCPVPLIVRR